MKNLYSSEALTANNKQALNRLVRAIALSVDQFSLILVCCNSGTLQEQVARQLQAVSAVEIQSLVLHPSVKTLLTTLLTTVKKQPPQALMVFGLESVVAIDQMLVSTNLVRNELSQHFSFPLILWINDEILQKLIRTAPDFKNWATSTIRFEVATNSQLAERKAIIA